MTWARREAGPNRQLRRPASEQHLRLGAVPAQRHGRHAGGDLDGYNPYDKHGVTNDMTKDQLNDLIEYLKTL